MFRSLHPANKCVSYFYSQFVHLSKVLRWLEAARLSVAGFCRDTEEEAAGRSGSGRAEEREF